MIVIFYIIVAVIGAVICTLIMVKVDEWRDESSMKRSRLSLNRSRCNAECVTDEVVVISDDESFDSSSSSRRDVQQVEYSSLRNVGVTGTSSNVARAAGLEACTSSSSQQQQQDILTDDESDDEDVVVANNVPKGVSNRSQSMFNWNKKSFANKWSPFFDNAPCGSRCNEQSSEARGKRQKLMSETTRPNDESMGLEDLRRGVSPPEVTIQHERMITGVKVKFPVNPYACQMSIVSLIIRGCKNGENCLLESPTGSGKTLALLCGVLAWQEQCSEEIYRENSEIDMESSSCSNDDSLEESFFLNLSSSYSQSLCEEKNDKEVSKNFKPRKVPKIYYGTRTHKQIEQVVRELKKTAYRHKRMTILSSRDHSCIQNTERNKTDLCNELLDPKKLTRCPYYTERNKKDISSFAALESHGLETPWDIEDLVSLGRDVAACPYFAARALMTEADIIFCPYNYIVDPNIRESMQINLKDSIVILDEAHNIEDTCRDVASVKIQEDNLKTAAKECEKLSYNYKRAAQRDIYRIIQNYLNDVAVFLNETVVKDNDNRGEMRSDCWSGSAFLEVLRMHKVGSTRFSDFLAASKAAISDFNRMKEEHRPENMLPTISRETKMILEHLCFVMEILTTETTVNDYRAYVIETKETGKRMSTDTWISKNSCKMRTMKILCMNPAIVFAPLARTVRSVILASGTLSPMSSFESELGTKFHNKPSNLKHIITKDQLHVRCIPRGPTNKPLSATYEKVNSFDFQDELGRLVIQVCDAVPYGVLCFFSSYSVMRTMLARWKATEALEELSALKEIFVEPQRSEECSILMKKYCEVIRKSSSISFRQSSGAIFFAVFRGKVAEGIDFKDNEARCVLTIGIPYSYIRSEIAMKKKYNDDNHAKGLLNGSEWYTVNAFRALNQALGRCIRHKNDWGAVLLVDERLQQGEYTKYLPNWIKSMWLENSSYNLRIELEDFVALQVARERGKEYDDRKKSCKTVQD